MPAPKHSTYEGEKVKGTDGTFNIVPSLFYQLFTIHAQVQGNLVPCVYALLPDKKEDTYKDMLTGLIQI